MSNYDYDDALRTLEYLKKCLPFKPTTAIVSGSGLGDIAGLIDLKITISTNDIPNWPCSTAPGHEGKIILGKLYDENIIILQGRVHYYEGYSMKAVTFPTRILGMLGVKNFIATNAVGAINKNFKPGEIIAIRDHINLMGNNPLIGQNENRWNVRFPDMSHAYDAEIIDVLQDLGLHTGVYAAFTGPSFETPAEIRMAEILGADVAGMSTIPEVIVANSMGMKICVLSCVSNMAAGIEPDKTLTEQEVLENMKNFPLELVKIITRIILKLKQVN